jgi:hypothetical protein
MQHLAIARVAGVTLMIFDVYHLELIEATEMLFEFARHEGAGIGIGQMPTENASDLGIGLGCGYQSGQPMTVCRRGVVGDQRGIFAAGHGNGEVPRAAMAERLRLDAMQPEAWIVDTGQVIQRAIGRAGIDDQNLVIEIDVLVQDGCQHLPEYRSGILGGNND